jgi:hypothetical protein
MKKEFRCSLLLLAAGVGGFPVPGFDDALHGEKKKTKH